MELGLLSSSALSQKEGNPSLPSGIVTFLFTDIEGSTLLWESMPEAMRAAVAQHHTLLRQAIEANGGTVSQVIGDAFQAAFRLASDGLCAALAGQRALREAHWGPTGPLQVRMGLHIGQAELDTGQDALYQVSHTLNRAARVMSAGYGGQILLSQEAADLVERELPDGVTLKDLGDNRLKGMERTEHLYQVLAADLPQDFPALPTATTRANNLPVQITSFIGREKEIAEVGALLEQHRLVTLHGSGGTGKTRLALETAARQLDHYPAGAWLVDLGSLMEAETVPQAVATALLLQQPGNMPCKELLLHYLRDKHILLILDNCEHLLEACARLAGELLRACPKLTILVTSRETLGIIGEATYRVPSLSAPDPASSPLEALAQCEAVRLFVERAGTIQPGFRLSMHALPAVAQVCHRLDGIPLAIELAAARVNVLPVEQIASRLDDRFRLLTGGSRTALPRQRTLRASIDWSYSLLPEVERRLLQKLSIFSGGWSLEAAEAVCAFDGLKAADILDGLAALVSKSLVNMEPASDGEARFDMLETICEFAREKLADTGQGAAVRDRHLAYFTGWVEAAAPQLISSQQKIGLDRIKTEIDNLRAAMEWGNQTRHPAGLRVAVPLSRFFFYTNQYEEGRRWLALYLDRPAADAAHPSNYPLALHAQALASLAYLYSFESGDPAKTYAQASIDLVEGKIDPPGLAYLDLAAVVRMQEDFDCVSGYLETAERLAELEKDLWLMLIIKNEFGQLALRTGDMVKSREYFLTALELAGALGAPSHIGMAQLWLATAYSSLGDLKASAAFIKDGLNSLGLIGFKPVFDLMGAIALDSGAYALARSEFEKYIAAAHDAGFWLAVANGYGWLGHLSFVTGDEAEAGRFFQEAIHIIKQTMTNDVERQIEFTYLSTAYTNMLIWMGEYEKAKEWLQVEGRGQDASIHTIFLYHSGALGLREGRLAEAKQFLKQAAAATKLNRLDPINIPLYETCADFLWRQSRFDRSARLFGAIDQYRRQAGMPLHPRYRPYYDQILESLHQQLGEEGFEREFAVGQAQGISRAIDELEEYWGSSE